MSFLSCHEDSYLQQRWGERSSPRALTHIRGAREGSWRPGQRLGSEGQRGLQVQTGTEGVARGRNVGPGSCYPSIRLSDRLPGGVLEGFGEHSGARGLCLAYSLDTEATGCSARTGGRLSLSLSLAGKERPSTDPGMTWPLCGFVGSRRQWVRGLRAVI